MPCSDGPRPDPQQERAIELMRTRYEAEVRVEHDKRKEAEGVACALLNALHKELLMENNIKVKQSATKNGGIDIDKWWGEHRIADRKKMQGFIDSLSPDERVVLQCVLRDGV